MFESKYPHAVSALSAFLGQRRNKVVFGFHGHDAVPFRRLVAERAFFQMLTYNGFSVSFIENAQHV